MQCPLPLFLRAAALLAALIGPSSLHRLTAAESTPIGVTRLETPIEAALGADDGLLTGKTRVLLVGIDGSQTTATAVRVAQRWFETHEAARGGLRSRMAVSSVACANPDGLALKTPNKNQSSGNPTRGYPPKAGYYDSPTDPEAAYLWRWIGMHGPDVVVVVRAGEKLSYSFHGPDAFSGPLREKFSKQLFAPPAADLAVQLAAVPACDVGLIPAVAVEVPQEDSTFFLPSLLATLEELKLPGHSPARKELQRRLDRSPTVVAEELSKVYGHQLKQVAYIPALALVGRVRLGELTDEPAHRKDVERIVLPYFDGSQKLLPKNGSEQAGHLIFSELAARSDGKARDQYAALAKLAAEQIFDNDGKPLSIMPFHNEMSDAVFMAGPILAATGKLTGEQKYFDACATHLQSMRTLCLRSDGLYRHSPLDEAAWGRGNGFPALGLVWVLSEFPVDHPQRASLLAEFQKHMAAVLKHQDASGCWHQVIDRPQSYREFTATCMIGLAMQRGVKNGWLEKATFQPAVDRAWQAIKLRIGPDGKLVDVCTGTGKQKDLRAYYDRPAILGRDDRGGAMAIMFATEVLASQR